MIARATRLSFLVLLALVAVLMVLGARPVDAVGPYGTTTAAPRTAPLGGVDEVVPSPTHDGVPAGVRTAGVALQTLGGVATIAILPRSSAQSERRLLVGPVTLAI